VFTPIGCESTYHDMMEKFGTSERDILIGRIEDGQGPQQAKQE